MTKQEIAPLLMAACAVGIIFSGVLDGEFGIGSAVVRSVFVGGVVYQWRKDRQYIGAELIDNWFCLALLGLTLFW